MTPSPGTVAEDLENGGYIRIDASRGAIVCTGDIDGDSDMLAKYSSHAFGVPSAYAGGSNTGDGRRSRLHDRPTRRPLRPRRPADRDNTDRREPRPSRGTRGAGFPLRGSVADLLAERPSHPAGRPFQAVLLRVGPTPSRQPRSRTTATARGTATSGGPDTARDPTTARCPEAGGRPRRAGRRRRAGA